MEFYEVVNNRHVVREWKSEDISREVLERMIAAGLKAPTHDHQRNWEFIILHGRQEKETALQFAKAWSASQEENKAVSAMGTVPQRMYAYAMPRQYTMLLTAPYVVIPLFKGAGIFHAKAVNGLNSFASIWCVVENIFLLAATAEGLGSVVHIPVKKEPEQIKEFLKVPDGWCLPALVVLGYPVKDPLLPTQVKATVENKVHWNKW